MGKIIPNIICGGLFIMAFLMAAVTTASEIQQNGITSDAFFTGCITVAVAILALVGAFITVISQNHSLKRKIGGEKKEKSIHTQLGVSDSEKSISEQLGINSVGKSITEQLGVGLYGKSLAQQNAELLNAVNSYSVNESEKMKKFSSRQKDIAKTVDDVNCFLKDWEQKTINEQNLKSELAALKSSYEKALIQISALQTENKTLKHNNALLSSITPQQLNEKSDEQDYGNEQE